MLIIFLISFSISSLAKREEDNQTLTKDGSWCWFSDPRTVYNKGIHEKTYMGFVTSDGDITITLKDHQSGKEVKNMI